MVVMGRVRSRALTLVQEEVVKLMRTSLLEEVAIMMLVDIIV